MLNGKKSYLISFTALFSKKGYELAFGIDTVFDGIRNTKYHVTAPVYSTYRSLKLDTYKTANKVSYSATGLLGKNMKLASNVTEVEGVEVESVFGNVVSYLTDIYRYSNGEHAVMDSNNHCLQEVTPFLNVQKQIDRSTKADSTLHAKSERTVLAETFVPVYQSTFTYGLTSLEVKNQLTISAVGYEQDTHTATNSFADKILNTYKALLENQELASTSKRLDTSQPDQLTKSKMKKITYEGKEVLSSQNTLSEEVGELQDTCLFNKIDYDVENQASKAALRIKGDIFDTEWEQNALGYRESIYDVDALHDVNDTARQASYLADCTDKKAAKTVFDYKEQIEIETLRNPIKKDIHDVYSIVPFSDSDSLSMQADTKEPQKLINGLASEYVPGNVSGSIQSYLERDSGVTIEKFSISNLGTDWDIDHQTSVAVEGLKSLLVQTPEISRMSRLLEIMYGDKAFKIIEAGMENVIKLTVMQTTTDVDIHTISQTIIQHLLKGNSSHSSDSEIQKFVQGLATHTSDVQIESEELGQNQIKADGLEDKKIDAFVSTSGKQASVNCFVSTAHSNLKHLVNNSIFISGQSARAQYSDSPGNIIQGSVENPIFLDVDHAVFVTKNQNCLGDMEELISSNCGFTREIDHHQLLIAEVRKDIASENPINSTKAKVINDVDVGNSLKLDIGNKKKEAEAFMLEETCGSGIHSRSDTISHNGVSVFKNDFANADTQKIDLSFVGFTKDTQQETIRLIDKWMDQESEYEPQYTAHSSGSVHAVVEESEKVRKGTDLPIATLENKELGTRASYVDSILDYTKQSKREYTNNGLLIFLTESTSSMEEDSSEVDSTETADYVINYETVEQRPEIADYGMSYEAVEQQPATADYVTNYEAVEQQPATADYVTNYEAVEQQPATADYVTNYEAVEQQPATADYVTDYETLEQQPETANYGMNYEALEQQSETADYVTNYEASEQQSETADYVTNYEASEQQSETADYGMSYEAVEQQPATADYVTNYEAVEQQPATADYVTNYEASEQRPEAADYVIDYNNIAVDKPESGSYEVNYDANTGDIELGTYKEKILDTFTSVNDTAFVQQCSYDSIFVEWNSSDRQQLTMDAISNSQESGEINKLDNANLQNMKFASYDKGLSTVIEEMTMQQVGENIYDARMENAESSGADTISVSVTQKFEESYMDGSNKLGVLQDQVHATDEGGSIQTTVNQDTKANSITMTQDSQVHINTDGVRKKKRIVTHLQIAEQSSRRKRVYPTLLSHALKGKRMKNVIKADLIQPEEARRPNKKINTVLEHGSRATNETIPYSKKRKIWMILGKLASWSIWNWKKTR
ncbi:hypothetical protein [Brevibacillus laterosporus]|uniref:Uncharacterized protein n=1 Tax=Brevibacillus laterosporus TaxID=1465 RepID=A0AAP8Q8A0_BRELA|nr:hypothetical protein [Brevibacillus laterosporus]PPA90141.1 hypothetical protein C4A77_25315 [Brevibacillus laterosporus]